MIPVLYQIPPLRYDSVDPELPLLKYDYPQQVSVFGKLPKRAIQIPKYTGLYYAGFCVPY